MGVVPAFDLKISSFSGRNLPDSVLQVDLANRSGHTGLVESRNGRTAKTAVQGQNGCLSQ